MRDVSKTKTVTQRFKYSESQNKCIFQNPKKQILEEQQQKTDIPNDVDYLDLLNT